VKERVHVIGAGGHAKVVIATLRASGVDDLVAWDDDPRKIGTSVLGIKVLGRIEECPAGVSAVVAIGENDVRRRVVSRLDLRYVSAVHPSAVVHDSVVLGAGSVIFAGVIVQPETWIGKHVILNTGANIDHDCRIGDFAHAGPGAHLAGAVTLSEGAFLGTGASAIPGVRIGAWAVVGAGGVVVHPLEPGVTAVGCPARPIARGRGA
jgi:sugar O-acyltransferase (sialic acid O-acetyltransferase NeuD family)